MCDHICLLMWGLGIWTQVFIFTWQAISYLTTTTTLFKEYWLIASHVVRAGMTCWLGISVFNYTPHLPSKAKLIWKTDSKPWNGSLGSYIVPVSPDFPGHEGQTFFPKVKFLSRKVLLFWRWQGSSWRQEVFQMASLIEIVHTFLTDLGLSQFLWGYDWRKMYMCGSQGSCKAELLGR